MPETFFITTAIDYTNGAPHIGHAYEKILADVLARYHRLKGHEVFFLTGVDQHGQKVQQSADKEGVPPQEFVDAITAKFVALWDKLEVYYDGWAATTDDRHKRCVQAILQRLWDAGQLYKDKRGGYYSVRQEQFLTDKERNEQGEYGPEWGEVEFREEENYYFRLEQHKQWLLDLIDQRTAAGQPLVIPDFRVAELRNAVEKLSGDLCISRPKARLSWGIEFPFDPEFVTYVWFDALVNYISFAPGYDPSSSPSSSVSQKRAEGEEETIAATQRDLFHRWWPALHVIGKDILIPAHGVYWPIMLKALGFGDDQIPPLLVHGWWNIRTKEGDSEKMSKSLGNVIDPDALADKYGPEALRYYLMADIATGRDADFSEERLVQRYNSDLANSLGNLLNRALNMAWKYREGVLQRKDDNPLFFALSESPPTSGTPAADLHLVTKLSMLRGGCAGVTEMITRGPSFENTLIGDAQIDRFVAELLRNVGEANRLIEESAPWKLAKHPENAVPLDAVLYHLAEALRIVAILISPVMPRAAHGIFDQLGWKLGDSGRWQRFSLEDAKWGGLPDGHVLGKPTPLFPRIEAEKPE